MLVYPLSHEPSQEPNMKMQLSMPQTLSCHGLLREQIWKLSNLHRTLPYRGPLHQ